MKKVFVCSHEPTRLRMAAALEGFETSPRVPDEPVDILLRWGVADGPDNAAWIINRRGAVERSGDWEQVVNFLHANRIPTSNQAAPRYRVYLFDMRTFAITRRVGRTWRMFRPYRKLRELLAVRCRRVLYALGLHAGAVEVGVSRRGRLVITKVSSGPRLSAPLARRLAAAIHEYMNQHRYDPSDRQVVLGADPEFILRRRSTGRLVTANRFFPYRGMVGHDRLLRRSFGGRPLAELRPAPSADPHQLLRNLRRAMRRAILRTGRRIAFSAGSLPVASLPIGGHIHFSGISFTADFLWALDIYLGIPLLLLDHPVRAARRRRRYGYLGDFRFQRHGGFEYRTLPSWIISPTIALAVLCLAKTIAQEYHRLPRHLLARHELQRAFYQSYKEPFYERFPELWYYLEQVPTFHQYAEYIRPIKQWIDDRKTWPDHADINRRWLTPSPRRPRRRARRTRTAVASSRRFAAAAGARSRST